MSEHERTKMIDEARQRAWIRLLADPDVDLYFDRDHGARIEVVHAGGPLKCLTLDYPQ